MIADQYLQSEERQEAIKRQKAIFMSGEDVDTDVVNPMILRSWKRSRAFQVDPDIKQRPRVSDEELDMLKKTNSEFFNCALEVLSKMFSYRQEDVSSLSIATSSGVTLYISNRTSHKLYYPDAMEGCINTEEARGTNGIGTCIKEKCPIEIIGAEHYRYSGECWSCSSAPIFSPGGNLIGVVNVTQDRKAYHAHTHSMVKAAAYAIMEQMRLRSLIRQRELIMEMLGDGVVVLSPNGYIDMMNNKAAVMLGISSISKDMLLTRIIRSDDPLLSLIKKHTRIQDQELRLALTSGNELPCFLSLMFMPEGSCIITMRETGRVRNIAMQVAGSKAAYTFDRIIGESPALKQVMNLARIVAANNTTVLLLGESGTGKELFAQAIHNASPRASRPFVAVNCGAIPSDLVESELFGYDSGAFTGASRTGKPGKFDLADGGTIFLDEIGELPLAAQASLLRLLQNGEVTHVGGKTSHTVSVRVIAATNRNLEAAILEKSFRNDLYYRLNVFPLKLPPLRERCGDVDLLLQHFLRYFSKTLKKNIAGISMEALSILRNYDWPGNIRELENVMERMANIVGNGESISIQHIPSGIVQSARALSQNTGCPSGMLFDKEAEIIMDALRQTKGNVKLAASLLGISRGGLYVKIKRYGLNVELLRSDRGL